MGKKTKENLKSRFISGKKITQDMCYDLIDFASGGAVEQLPDGADYDTVKEPGEYLAINGTNTFNDEVTPRIDFIKVIKGEREGVETIIQVMKRILNGHRATRFFVNEQWTLWMQESINYYASGMDKVFKIANEAMSKVEELDKKVDTLTSKKDV